MNPTHKQNPSTEDILRIIRDIMTDKKCEEVSILNLESVNSYLSYFVICTVNSAVQANAVAREVRKTLKEYKLSHKETDKTGTSATSGWTLLDFGEIIVHIMTPEKREYYNLDRLWRDAKRIEL
ncbi:ribosome silencing factor [Leptospira interrogans]|uniref:Ribosomal silencing factor RsfS n=24 Tax=Leptospira TaxID=171 RepID=Q8F6E4_LEPIN|nr:MULTISPECIES: ribosome silencing factor [Leptospira]APH42178.1 Ribosomal silencing factor RsfS [Leptospira interrogans serovar Copenhageni/Icterohaemorrhagiae]EMG12858.1 ribosome silencing factor [Leptospira interrogans serovar Grippotyphosa str. LT2186]EMG23978.1 ribosome silencing factor [Leptospira interrogans serovar Copenhageni str. LT2050]EMM82018.1 ribosome silencing factor [Leptospira interrogans str. 2006001854]EMN50522.1 ribosome silencing factor [Leptospira interrogans str. L1207